MYIIKNALRCIGRSKGRSILIGIIALVIAVSSCLGLSIRQAAESAKESTLEGLSVTATIAYDRSAMMKEMMGGAAAQPGGQQGGQPGGMFDRDQFARMMGGDTSLSLEEYEKYASAESVQDYYYTITASFNGSDAFQPVSNEAADSETAESETEDQNAMAAFGAPGMNFPGMQGAMGMLSSSDFSVVGYSGDNAMTAFKDGTSAMKEGAMFEEGTSDYVCVISEELALYNNLSVGDTVTITNPSLESETYDLKITGIYENAASNDFSMAAFGKSQDPANQIYVSAAALQKILDASDKASVTVTDEDSGESRDSAVTGSVSPSYVLADTEAYDAFEKEVRELGLDDAYVVGSSDIESYNQSLTPLNTLSTMAGWFLIVILVIGAIILVVLNIFNVRERKYEVGVLTAMGMKKWKVAAQFVCEILVITMVAIIIGAIIGAVCSVPVTNALLKNQVESRTSQQTQMEENFGRPGGFGGMPGGGTDSSSLPGNPPGGGGSNPFTQMMSGATNYITEVNSAMNLTVVLQMLGVGLLLTLAASMASVMFIMRYDPLKILANRD